MEIKTTPNQLFKQMPTTARVWIYQANRILTIDEALIVQEKTAQFIEGWAAHGSKLMASFELVDNLFLIISVDEQVASASGCSIDSCVHFIQKLQAELNLDFFNRLNVAFMKERKLKICTLNEFEAQVKSGEINQQTLVFNNTIQSVSDLKNNWLVEAQNSWHSRYF